MWGQAAQHYIFTEANRRALQILQKNLADAGRNPGERTWNGTSFNERESIQKQLATTLQG